MSEIKLISRKDFLKKAGVTVAGIAVTGTLAGALTGCTTKPTASLDTSQAPEWPLPYKKLDPKVVEARAFTAYKERGG